MLTQMHSFSSLVVGYQDRSQISETWIDKSLKTVRHRVKWVKNVKDSLASGQLKIHTYCVYTSNCDEHT